MWGGLRSLLNSIGGFWLAAGALALSASGATLPHYHGAGAQCEIDTRSATEVPAHAPLRLSFLGPGPVDADPATLSSADTPVESTELMRDTGGGSWWRIELTPAGAALSQNGQLPLVLYFSGTYSAELLIIAPASGERHGRGLRTGLGPSWGARTEMPVLLGTAVQPGAHIHVHIKDRTGRRVRPQLSTLDDYLSHSIRTKVSVTASTVVLLMLALLAALLYRSFRIPSYGWLALMACACAGYALEHSGELYRLPGGDWLAALGSPVHRSFSISAVIFSHLFIISFLQLNQRRPRAGKVMMALVWLQVLVLLATWLEGKDANRLGATVSNLLILLSIPIMFYEAWRAHRSGLSAGRYVLLAWSPAMLLLTLWIAVIQDWLPIAGIDMGNLVSAAMALQVAVLLLGLAEDSSRLRQERDLATHQAGHDPLTGAWNRRALQQQMAALMRAAGEQSTPLCVAFLDLDHFKRINDQLGHAVGDQCLQRLVKLIERQLPENGLLARYGGEEFVIVLPEQTAASARAWADDLRLQIAARPIDCGEVKVELSASLGISEMTADDRIETLLRRADQALYRAKRDGRNRVELATTASLATKGRTPIA